MNHCYDSQVYLHRLFNIFLVLSSDREALMEVIAAQPLCTHDHSIV